MERRSWRDRLLALRFVAGAVAALLVGVAFAAEEPPKIPAGTHEQVKVISPTGGDASLKLSAFCVDKQGNVVALVNQVAPPKPAPARNAPATAKPRIRMQLRTAPKATDKIEKKIETKPADDKSADATKTGSGELRVLKFATADEPATFETASGSAGEVQVAQAEAPAAETEEAAEAKLGNAEVRILDADGKLLTKFPVDFEAQAINVDADGSIVVGGDGIIARYDVKGKELRKMESPHMAKMAKNAKEVEDQAREQLKSQGASMESALKALEKQKAELDAKKDEDLTAEERTQKTQLDRLIQTYKRSVENYSQPKEAQLKSIVQQISGRARKISAIAANGKHVFVTCSDPKGYGFSVWRTDSDFQNPKHIVNGLRGCCGQMDVQCCGDDLVVAENSRKRVARYDAEGKNAGSFGKDGRDGAGDAFGSCCNPMNTRLYDGKLLVSDSDGRVRLFSLDGKYEGEVGRANVQPGCKSSTVDISPDGKRLYYINVHTSQICVLDRKAPDDKQASVQ
jgi:hypothetical protein